MTPSVRSSASTAQVGRSRRPGTAASKTPKQTTPEVAALLREYDELEDQIERSASEEVWALARWLAENVPVAKPGPKIGPSGGLTIKDVAAHGRRGVTWLQTMRKTALAFGDDVIEGKSVKEHAAALEKAKGDVPKALKAMQGGADKGSGEAKSKSSVASTKTKSSDSSTRRVGGSSSAERAEESEFDLLMSYIGAPPIEDFQEYVADLTELSEDQARQLREQAANWREIANLLDAVAAGVSA